MYLSPSSIHFTNCTGQTAIHEITNENDIEMLSRKFVEKKGILPKIQVVQKEGHYFTLNNTQLQVFRRLEQEGYCHNVKAEVIAIKRIPLPIRQMMTLPPSEEDDDEEDKQGYSKESHNVGKNGSQSDTSNDDNDEDDGDSLSSYSLESNSDNDVTDLEDEDADTDEESSTDASTEEELEEERESLL